MTIIYYADDASMGDTPPDACQRYRTWALAQLQDAYPTHAVQVLAIPSLGICWTDDDNRDAIYDYCHRLWDRCPWDWEEDAL